MLCQTTNSGGNNNPMALELESMFAKAEKPVTWDSKSHHIRCYAHKLNLTVGHGLKLLGQKVSTTKSTIPHGVPLPIPTLQVNNSEDGIEIDEDESDDEDDEGLPEKPSGVDDDEDHDQSNDQVGEKEDIIAIALVKVCLFPFFFFYPFFCIICFPNKQ
jgi:hypothetical protein